MTDRACALAIGGVAVLVRLPLMFGTHEQTAPDSKHYFDAASAIASIDGLPGYFYGPGYSIFIGLLSVLPGREEDIVSVVQHLLGAGLTVAVFFAARRWFGLLAASVAASFAALGPVMLFHEHSLLPDFLFGLLVFAGALLLAEACTRGGDLVRLLAAAGLVFGVATWVKPAGQFLFFAAPLPLLFATREWRRALRGSAIVAGMLLLTITPWIVRNAIAHDYAGMSIQSGSTLFNRAFEVSELPIPPSEEHGALAKRVRAKAQQRPRARFHYEFHQALVNDAGLSDSEALCEQRSMALHAIRTNPGAYATDSVTLLAESLQDISNFEGRASAEAKLADSPIPSAVRTALLDLAGAITDIWWILCLQGFAAVLVLVTGDSRRRAAGAALISVWLVVALGTVLTHGGQWRYSMQLAPLTLILASAGCAILVTGVRDRLRRARSAA